MAKCGYCHSVPLCSSLTSPPPPPTPNPQPPPHPPCIWVFSLAVICCFCIRSVNFCQNLCFTIWTLKKEHFIHPVAVLFSCCHQVLVLLCQGTPEVPIPLLQWDPVVRAGSLPLEPHWQNLPPETGHQRWAGRPTGLSELHAHWRWFPTAVSKPRFQTSVQKPGWRTSLRQQTEARWGRDSQAVQIDHDRADAHWRHENHWWGVLQKAAEELCVGLIAGGPWRERRGGEGEWSSEDRGGGRRGQAEEGDSTHQVGGGGACQAHQVGGRAAVAAAWQARRSQGPLRSGGLAAWHQGELATQTPSTGFEKLSAPGQFFIGAQMMMMMSTFMVHDSMNPLGPRPHITACSFALLCNHRPPGSGWLADAPY